MVINLSRSGHDDGSLEDLYGVQAFSQHVASCGISIDGSKH